jgi:hypothetical protein
VRTLPAGLEIWAAVACPDSRCLSGGVCPCEEGHPAGSVQGLGITRMQCEWREDSVNETAGERERIIESETAETG